MEIIAQKTAYYNPTTFFNEVILEPFVDGVAFHLIFTKDRELLIYSPGVNDTIGIMNLQDFSTKTDMNLALSLDDALGRIQKGRKNLKVLLNLIPIQYELIDDASFMKLGELNQEYVNALKAIIDKYPTLNISIHSTSRNLLVNVKRTFKRRVGFLIYGGDLNLMDVDYYVFTTNMIDDAIFDEEINRGKEIYLQMVGLGDLALITSHYDSKHSTALSRKVLPHIRFISSQPDLLYRVLKSF